jgi:hypothetical protein
MAFTIGLLIGYFGKEHITALLIKAKDKRAHLGLPAWFKK